MQIALFDSAEVLTSKYCYRYDKSITNYTPFKSRREREIIYKKAEILEKRNKITYLSLIKKNCAIFVSSEDLSKIKELVSNKQSVESIDRQIWVYYLSAFINITVTRDINDLLYYYTTNKENNDKDYQIYNLLLEYLCVVK